MGDKKETDIYFEISLKQKEILNNILPKQYRPSKSYLK